MYSFFRLNTTQINEKLCIVLTNTYNRFETKLSILYVWGNAHEQWTKHPFLYQHFQSKWTLFYMLQQVLDIAKIHTNTCDNDIEWHIYGITQMIRYEILFIVVFYICFSIILRLLHIRYFYYSYYELPKFQKRDVLFYFL